MNPELQEAVAARGAVSDPNGRPRHFGEPALELRAALESCVVADRSDLGRIHAAGPDILDLLHRMGTADVAGLEAGSGRQTTLLTPKGRIIQRVFVHHLGEAGVLMVTGAGGAAITTGHLDRFTFQEKTGLTDVTDTWSHLAVVGPAARKTLAALGVQVPDALGSVSAKLGGVDVHVTGTDGLSTGGFSFVVPGTGVTAVWDALVQGGGHPTGDDVIEAWRVLSGLPDNGRELTEEHNPLEAGLWDAVSFDKGCYVGQEVVARLRTYDKVTRDLKGFLGTAGSPVPTPGTQLFDGDSPVGAVTSAVVPPGRTAPVGLAFVRTRSGEITEVGTGPGPDAPKVSIVDLPFGDTP